MCVLLSVSIYLSDLRHTLTLLHLGQLTRPPTPHPSTLTPHIILGNGKSIVHCAVE